MQKYVYKAWDSKYKLINGSIEEENINSAKQLLIEKGLYIIEINEFKDLLNNKLFQIKIKDEELANFCGQLAVIISSGVNLISGLDIIAKQIKNKRMKKILENIVMGVKRGRTLSQAMKDDGKLPNLLIDMVKAGESSGQVDTMLYNLETFYEREASIKSKIKSASVYPTILLFMSVGMIIFFNNFIFVELKDLFTDNENLPLITKLLLISMDALNNNTVPIIIGVISIIIMFKYLMTKHQINYIFNEILLNIPLIGKLKKEILVSRFTRSMGLFIRSGVSLLIIFDNLKLIVNNDFVSAKIDEAKQDVVNGNTIAYALDKSKLFEPIVVQMIEVGEETGTLEEILFKIAAIYDKKSEASISKLMELIEPIFTLLIGIFIAVLILAMALPVFQMTSR